MLENRNKLIQKAVQHPDPRKTQIFIVEHPKKAFLCGHPNELEMARGMCRRCYAKFGRTKTAIKCGHPERKLFCRGWCKACYLKF